MSDTKISTTVPKARKKFKHPWSTVLAIVFSILWLFPVYWMINTAFKPRAEILTQSPHFWPHQPTLENFSRAITQNNFFTSFKNSVIVAGGAVVLAIILGLLAAAALSRFRFRGRRTVMVFILIVQMLPGTALLIPMFIVFQTIGLLGSYWALILAYLAAVLPFSIWVMRGFYVAIPFEIEEAAMVDGAGTFRILWSILFPLVAPGVVSTSIFAFITAWNDYLIAYVFMKDQSRYTLPVWLQSFTTPFTGTDYGGQMAGSVLFALPVVIFFLLIQRNLVSGMSAGAVKG